MPPWPTRHPVSANVAVLLIAAALLCACHDAHRSNPMDPVLTPPVELNASVDDTSGAVILRWTRYQGQQPLDCYRVLRAIEGSADTDTLATIADVDSLAWADTTRVPGVSYRYRVEAINIAGFACRAQVLTVGGVQWQPVSLQRPAFSPATGAVRLDWSRYRSPLFREYRLLRHNGPTNADTLVWQSVSLADTTATDTTVRHGLEYTYQVQVRAADQELTSNGVSVRVQLPPPAALRARAESATTSATTTWTRYRGPRFAAYELWRRSEGASATLVATRSAAGDTVAVDSLPRGDTEYRYQIQVLTTCAERVAGPEATASIHRLIDSWPLPMGIDDQVRLYREPGNRLGILVSGWRTGVVWEMRDAGGSVIERVPLILGPQASGYAARSASVTQAPEGGHYLCVAAQDSLRVLRFTGHTVQRQTTVALFTREFSAPLSAAERLLPEQAGVFMDYAKKGVGEVVLHLPSEGVFADMGLTDGQRLVAPVDLSAGLPSSWVGGDSALASDGVLLVRGMDQYVWASSAGYANPGVTAQIRASTAGTGIFLGAPAASITASSFRLWLDCTNAYVFLQWRFLPPSGAGLRPRTRQFQAPFQGLTGHPYWLSLAEDGAYLRCSLADPWLWTRPTQRGAGWATLLQVGDETRLTTGSAGYDLAAGSAQYALIAAVSESRYRRLAGSKEEVLAFCLPTENRVTYADGDRATWRSRWPAYMNTVGGVLGSGPGECLVPLSCDVGPDGRVFVLDSVNQRIQSFDLHNHCLTQWGSRGSGPGEFDFGSGPNEDFFRGSIAVDDSGYVYVADPGNQRIQKFTP